MGGKLSSLEVKPHIVAYHMIYKIADKCQCQWRIKIRRPSDRSWPFGSSGAGISAAVNESVSLDSPVGADATFEVEEFLMSPYVGLCSS